MNTNSIVENKQNRIHEADFLRMLCCLGVVMIHVSGYIFIDKFWNATPLFTQTFFVILNEGVRYSLFGFVFLSGLLLTINDKSKLFNAKEFITRRAKLILLPYISFWILYFILSAKLNPHIINQTIGAFQGNADYIRLFISRVLYGSWPHLYFFCMLFQLYFVYAIFHKQITKILNNKKSAIIYFFVLLALYPIWCYLRFFVMQHPDIITNRLLLYIIKNPTRQIFEWLFAFYVGLLAGKYYLVVFEYLKLNWLRLLLTITGIIMLLGLIYIVAFAPAPKPWWINYLVPILRLIYGFCFVFLMIYFGKKLYNEGTNFTLINNISAYSFGIYLLHPMILSFMRDFFWVSGKMMRITPYLYLIVTFLVATIVPYYIVHFSMQFASRYPKYNKVHRFVFGR